MIVTAKFGSEIVISPDGRTVDVTALAGGGFAAGWAEQNQTITSLQALFLDFRAGCRPGDLPGLDDQPGFRT